MNILCRIGFHRVDFWRYAHGVKRDVRIGTCRRCGRRIWREWRRAPRRTTGGD